MGRGVKSAAYNSLRTGVEAIPVVAGVAVASGVGEQAQASGVWQVTNGRTAAPVVVGPSPSA